MAPRKLTPAQAAVMAVLGPWWVEAKHVQSSSRTMEALVRKGLVRRRLVKRVPQYRKAAGA